MPHPFHLMAKPIGPICNLNCTYCFYLEKENLSKPKKAADFRMSDQTLEAYIQKYIAAHAHQAEILFTWHGGEPTLLGLPFYEKVVRLQQKHANGMQIKNSLQTNGTLLNDAWCQFFAEHAFFIGLSLDGPDFVHDPFRVTKSNAPTHARVLEGLTFLQKHQVDYNILACVNKLASYHALDIYHFFKSIDVRFVQFTPVVERTSSGSYKQAGFSFQGPDPTQDNLTEWTVEPLQYGRFLTEIFDEWVKQDVGERFIMNFEWALANYLGLPGGVCVHNPTCGDAAIVEHTGDVFSCDHFVYPEFRLGNIHEQNLLDMMMSAEQTAFGNAKKDSLTKQCQTCPVLRGCNGGCPKHRFRHSKDGEPGQHYLCEGYYHFFTHIVPYMQAFKQLMQENAPLSDIMHRPLAFVRKTPSV